MQAEPGLFTRKLAKVLRGRPPGRRGGKMRSAGLLWFAGVVFGQQALWETHVQEGDRLAQAGRYQEAREAYQFALHDPDTPAQPGLQAARWNDLALMNRYLGNLVEGREQYWRA